MRFASRVEAGRCLGERLQAEGVVADLVLGLPRGGVVVAKEVARVMGCPLAALVVRKIGHPHHREMAVGAIAEPDVVVFDEPSLGWSPPTAAELAAVEREEIQRLRQYQQLFHPAGIPELGGEDVLLVDDGLATGATMEAAVRVAKQQDAEWVTVAVPVASASAAERIKALADGLVALVIEADFFAVGNYYDVFTQVSDAEVVALLKSPA